MRHFAKLFDFEALGQLLVQRVNSEDEDDDAPYRIELKTRNEQGVQLVMGLGFVEEELRDEQYAAFEPRAEEHFTKMQTALAAMTDES
ncbi:hypothetical protein [Hymenobacter sp.]|uniref:hypothetical protein n=1 Tax=Hymenobacter sp. TaxID=1898978 RepID=UPI00286B2534|nr:hypothetical protein [Hymenobacter sp.]